jgi:hypothetical protein
VTWMDFTTGWEVIVQRKTADRAVPATVGDERGDLVVRWRARRVAWIEELCAAGEGVDLGGNWYPTRFTLPARHLRHILDGETPPDCKTQAHPEWPPYRTVPALDLFPEVAVEVDDSEWLLLTVFDTS